MNGLPTSSGSDGQHIVCQVCQASGDVQRPFTTCLLYDVGNPYNVMLSAAKHLCAPREGPFAARSRSSPLSAAKGSGLRLTQGDNTLQKKRQKAPVIHAGDEWRIPAEVIR